MYFGCLKSNHCIIPFWKNQLLYEKNLLYPVHSRLVSNNIQSGIVSIGKYKKQNRNSFWHDTPSATWYAWRRATTDRRTTSSIVPRIWQQKSVVKASIRITMDGQRDKSCQWEAHSSFGNGVLPDTSLRVSSDGVYFYNPQKHLREPVMKGDFRVLCGTQE